MRFNIPSEFELEKVCIKIKHVLENSPLIHTINLFYQDFHSGRTQEYFNLLSKKLNYTFHEKPFQMIFHDLGKLAYPEGFFEKPGKFNQEEDSKKEFHTLIGGEILKYSSPIFNTKKQESIFKKIDFPTAIDIAFTHHEHYDGTGYPLGLQGEEIPVSGRIAHLIDIFDALSSKRPYKERFDKETVFKIFQSGDKRTKVSYLDPKMRECFLDCFDEFWNLSTIQERNNLRPSTRVVYRNYF
jgi:response regulator RpfG family c-di-GMP phosphodiesterase